LLLQEGKDKKGKKDAPAAAAMEEEYRNYMQLERVSIGCLRLFSG